MYSEQLEAIIDAALADGVLTDKEREVLYRRAAQEGVDADELDVVIEGRLAKVKQQIELSKSVLPKSSANEKKGNVVKCPNCGCPDVAGRAICPECGYAFTNIGVSSSIERFNKELSELNRSHEEKTKGSSFWDVITVDKKRDKQVANKMDFISKFPVPNSRADLLEFLQMIQPSAKATGPKDGLTGFDGMSNRKEDVSYAYWLLFANCINKAKASFQQDRDFAPFFEFYDEEVAKSKGIMAFYASHKQLVTSISLIFVMFLIFGPIMTCALKEDEKREQELKQEIPIIKPQVDQQYEKLCSAIEALGIPTEENYEENAFALLNITWNTISTIGTEYSPNPYEAEKKKSFLKKKEFYANRLQQIYKDVYGYSEENDSLNAEYDLKTPEEIKNISFEE